MYLKAFHIISFTSWFAMLFYQPRLFVYHAEHMEKKDFVEVIKIMERKLFYFIGIPSMWATIISGFVLIYLNPGVMSMGWMHIKLLLIAILVAYFYSIKYYLKKLEADACTKSGRFFRWYNEVPTLVLLATVFLAVLKPF